MYFILYCKDKPASLDLRLANRQAHLDYVKNSTCVRLGGPILGDDNETMAGSVLVLELDTLSEARAWSDADPYTKAGLFGSIDIRPFRWTVGNPALAK
ncbi:MAG: YciI family protein [Pseudomonadota bacterium]